MMRHVLTVVLAVSLPLASRAAESEPLKDGKEKLSYSIGMTLATGWKRQSIDVDTDALLRGVKDSLSGKTLITEEDARGVLMAFQRELRAKQEEGRKQQGEKNKKEGEAFLAQNKTKPGVVTLPSGLQYKVLAEGKGESPKATDTVSVNYKGTLTDGTEFDSSYKRGQPASFQVTGVIKGWTEALQLMKPGAKWQLFIPSELGYREQGSGPLIGPNAVLVFEVELVSVKGAPAAQNEPVTSDIIKVPSAEELKAGAKIEVIKASDLEKYKEKEKAEKAKSEKK